MYKFYVTVLYNTRGITVGNEAKIRGHNAIKNLVQRKCS
jgi:hypothetical protein